MTTGRPPTGDPGTAPPSGAAPDLELRVLVVERGLSFLALRLDGPEHATGTSQREALHALIDALQLDAAGGAR